MPAGAGIDVLAGAGIDVWVDVLAEAETDVLPGEPVEALAVVLAVVLTVVPAVMPAVLATDDSHCDGVEAKQVVPCCQVLDAGDDDNDNDFVDVQFCWRN